MPDPTPAQAAAQIVAYFGALDAMREQEGAWLTGAADGGPNGDGLYPYTTYTGQQLMLPSPAKMIADMGGSNTGGGSLDQEGVNALPIATAQDVPASLAVIGQAANGTPKRFPTNLFASRRTADRDVLPGSETAEWIDCLSNTGVERKIPLSLLTRQFGGVIDPTQPPFNVKYDYQKARDVEFTAGGDMVMAADPAFRASRDLGKMIVVGNAYSGGAMVGYIAQVIDTRTVRVTTDAGLTTPIAWVNTRGSEECVWGTDNTAGMQAAFDAAEAESIYSQGGTVVIGGMALVRELRFGSISIVGLNDIGCGFVALPYANRTQPFIADKNTGRYGSGQLKPDGYTLRNLHIIGQKYTQLYSSFRAGLSIRGGDFSAFYRGAPYARIDGVELYEHQTNGFEGYGAFAGGFNNIRARGNAHCGIRVGLWDLNGVNWHCEGNGAAGVFSYMAGGNVVGVRSSYNGEQGGVRNLSGQYWPHELGSNWTEAGYGSTVTNLRMQESWSHSLCFTNRDPLNAANSGGRKCAFFLGALDDTANVSQKQSNPSRLPTVRAMIYIKGNTCTNNVIDQMTGSGQVVSTNWATHGYFDEGNPSGNQVNLRTPGITNAPADWYAGRGAVSPGPWGTSSASSIAARGNQVVVNGASAP